MGGPMHNLPLAILVFMLGLLMGVMLTSFILLALDRPLTTHIEMPEMVQQDSLLPAPVLIPDEPVYDAPLDHTLLVLKGKDGKEDSRMTKRGYHFPLMIVKPHGKDAPTHYDLQQLSVSRRLAHYQERN